MPQNNHFNYKKLSQEHTIYEIHFRKVIRLCSPVLKRFNHLKNTSIVKICFPGVNLFHVDGKGEVSPWTSPCALEIFQILKQGFGTYLGLTL